MRVFVGLVCVALAGWPGAGLAGRRHGEAWYQAQWCAERNGQAEVSLGDGTRVDCLTSTHAVEFDFADKWAEAIGQSLHYARQSGIRAGVVLIVESADDRRFWVRLTGTIEHFGLPIDTWQAGAGREALIGEGPVPGQVTVGAADPT